MEDQLDVFMRETDAFSWCMERDPELRSTSCTTAGPPEADGRRPPFRADR